jgi:hypothetical protein
VNTELLTDPDCLQRLFAEENGCVITGQDLALIDLEAIWNRWMTGEL